MHAYIQIHEYCRFHSYFKWFYTGIISKKTTNDPASVQVCVKTRSVPFCSHQNGRYLWMTISPKMVCHDQSPYAKVGPSSFKAQLDLVYTIINSLKRYSTL